MDKWIELFWSVLGEIFPYNERAVVVESVKNVFRSKLEATLPVTLGENPEAYDPDNLGGDMRQILMEDVLGVFSGTNTLEKFVKPIVMADFCGRVTGSMFDLVNGAPAKTSLDKKIQKFLGV